MSITTMEDFKPVNAMEEVKKLQELVRKLEIQNLQLRNKQNMSRKRSVSPVKEVKPSPKNSRPVRKTSEVATTVDNDTDFSSSAVTLNKDEYFDDLEIIKVSDIELSDDESWLYTSPKSENQSRNETTHKWLRNGGEVENKQLQFSKNALLTKLNELEILSTPNRTVPHPGNPAINNLRRSQLIFKNTASVQNHDSLHIDSRTFTRSKKKQAIDFLEKLEILNDERNRSSDEFHLHRRGSDVSSDSLSSCHVLEDANDVQEVARMQEESLRMNSPIGTPKRNSGNNLYMRKVSTSSRGSTSDQDISESSVFGLQIVNVSSTYDCVETSHQVETCLYSDQSSPSESPYGSNASLHNVGKEKVKLGGYRRSLPNLNKDPSSARQTKARIENSSVTQSNPKERSVGRRSDSGMHAVQKIKRDAKSPCRLKQSNMSLPQAVFMSPENEITTATKSSEPNDSRQRIRSGLPKPSRASSATRAIPRSGIPMPSMLGKKRVEDSWSEGCF